MYNFKNAVLQREHKGLLSGAIKFEKGEIGGLSIEIETKDPTSYESYLYKGRTAESDRDHDFKILENLFRKPIN